MVKPKQLKKMAIVVVLLVFAIIFRFTFWSHIVSASISQMYATECIGGWENPQLVSGAPQITDYDNNDLGPDNSARLIGNFDSQIVCSGFSGEIIPDTVPNSISVKLSWAAHKTEEIIITPEIIIPVHEKESKEDKDEEKELKKEEHDESKLLKDDKQKDAQESTDDTHPDNETNNLEEKLPDELEVEESTNQAVEQESPVVENPSPESNSETEDTVQESSSSTEAVDEHALSYFINLFIPSVYAEEDPTQTPAPEPSPEPAPEQVLENEPATEESANDAVIENSDTPSDATSEIDTEQQERELSASDEPLHKNTEEQSEQFQESATDIPNATDDDTIAHDETSEDAGIVIVSTEYEPEETTELSPTPHIIELMYSLDGFIWNSIGYVELDDLQEGEFEIPMNDISTWEDISQLQISVHNIPGYNNAQPIIYIDALWIEVEYSSPTDKADLDTTIEETTDQDEVSDEQSEEIIDPDQENITVDEEANPEALEEAELAPDELEKIDEELLLLDNEPLIDSIPEDAPAVDLVDPYSFPSFPLLKFRKLLIDKNAQHACKLTPYTFELSANSEATSTIEMVPAGGSQFKLEVGALPKGVTVLFTNSNKSEYSPNADETTTELLIQVSSFPRIGNFNIPIIYTNINTDSITACSFNIHIQ